MKCHPHFRGDVIPVKHPAQMFAALIGWRGNPALTFAVILFPPSLFVIPSSLIVIPGGDPESTGDMDVRGCLGRTGSFVKDERRPRSGLASRSGAEHRNEG